jgi:hypothetical protein
MAIQFALRMAEENLANIHQAVTSGRKNRVRFAVHTVGDRNVGISMVVTSCLSAPLRIVCNMGVGSDAKTPLFVLSEHKEAPRFVLHMVST